MVATLLELLSLLKPAEGPWQLGFVCCCELAEEYVNSACASHAKFLWNELLYAKPQVSLFAEWGLAHETNICYMEMY